MKRSTFRNAPTKVSSKKRLLLLLPCHQPEDYAPQLTGTVAARTPGSSRSLNRGASWSPSCARSAAHPPPARRSLRRMRLGKGARRSVLPASQVPDQTASIGSAGTRRQLDVGLLCRPPASSRQEDPSPSVRRPQLRLRDRRRARPRRRRKPGLPQAPHTKPPAQGLPAPSRARSYGGTGGGKPHPMPPAARGGAWPRQAPPTPRALPQGNRHNTTRWPPRRLAPEGSDGRVSARPRPAGPLGSASPP